MEVCSEAAGRYPSNYNAWSHRIWVLQNVAKLDLKAARFLPSASLKWQAPSQPDSPVTCRLPWGRFE
uniref:Protein prenyltransferase alpha subunit repeat containing 1 n=1 Tax=Mus musculus TaxID=10090 RepID=E9QAB6_MOUSE